MINAETGTATALNYKGCSYTTCMVKFLRVHILARECEFPNLKADGKKVM